ncbi:MAG TPA: pyridoxamine 5'-phosphate oxidase family protein [Actinomycetota bacterium]|nr:pyridoxamine 5'-phosphate oxidase family protein [Actinomycetota bacterium]
MNDPKDIQAVARSIIDSNKYMTLATADSDGVPWASPVWYAPAEYRQFFWVSSPEAMHSRNLAVRPRLAIVISARTGPAVGTRSTCRRSPRRSPTSTK